MEQVDVSEKKTSSPDSGDGSTITSTNSSSSSSFSGDVLNVVHVEHDDVNNGNVYLDGGGSESSDDDESQTVDHLKEEEKVREFEKGSSSEDKKRLHDEIDELQEGDIPEEVDVIEEEEVDIEDVKDYKAKELLENQKTPDLLCPKCKTCITKVVVLKKRVVFRKRRPSNSHGSVTRPSPVDLPSLGSGDNQPTSVGGNNDHLPDQSFFYKCLSCFCIFKSTVVNPKPVPDGEGVEEVNTQPKPHAKVDFNCLRGMFGFKELDVQQGPEGPSHHGIYIPPPVSFPGEATQLDPLLTPAVVARPVVVEGRKVEILKSIVFGGLTEAITSLGVISSAAGSGASTLNILVLGLANLFSGLILIIHNLQELKEEPTKETTDDNQTNGQEESRYKQLLGRRENFILHATVAILSFIITGLLPPVVYYFSFKETHNKDYKVASVFGASLICIVLLAIAKAHVRNPRGSYLKSVLYYAMNAVSVSGITFVAGNVANQLLEKYGWSDGSDTPAGEMMLSLMGRKAGGFGYSSSY